MVIKPEPISYGSITINYHETATNSITDLTGTKWLFNEAPENAWGEPYNISFTSNNENFVALYADEDDLYGRGRGLKYFATTPSGSPYDFVHAYNSRIGVWANQSYRTIEITGGTDATNANLIAWLQANATQIEDESNTFSFGNLPIENVYFGTRQVKKVYLGNTLVWEKEETGYTVTLNCGGGSSYTKGSVHVYDSTYEDISSSNLIFSQGSIDLSTYPATLTVKSGHCTVSVETSGSFMGSYLTSSDFTTSHGEGTMTKEFVVDKNGTIEFGATDWDD